MSMPATRRMPLPPRGLYAITLDVDQSADALAAQVAAALAGGAVVVQYRRKQLARATALVELAALRPLCTAARAPLIVNDDIELALAANADGVHLGRDDGDWATLAADTRRRLLLGLSCYADVERAVQAAQHGVDYVAFGSFFPSDTKPLARPCPLAVLETARRRLAVPIVAIGGITPENGAHLVRAGADFLAVISGLFAQPSISAAAARYANLFGETHV
ncbi:MAG: thiamine phosphate synthase [Gammaproteobacteria bacterium]